MKIRIQFLGVLLIVLAMIPFGANAQDKYVPKANEELYGTWTNEQNSKGIFHPQKIVSNADGYKLYTGISDSLAFEEGTMQIDRKWTDSEGNIWYKTFGIVTRGVYKGDRWQELDKLSKSGNVWERALTPLGTMEFNPNYFPTKIDPQQEYYRILYRVH